MGRAELQFQNFTRGGLKVELCQSERSLRKVWQFRAAIFRGEMQKEDRDIWDDTYLNFCINTLIQIQFWAVLGLESFRMARPQCGDIRRNFLIYRRLLYLTARAGIGALCR